MSAPSLVIVDATFLRHLASERTLARLDATCRVVHARIWPSAINAIEALKHTNDSERERLVNALARWAGDRPLIPWPPIMLARWARAIERGEPRLLFRGTKLDALVRDPRALAGAECTAARLAAETEAAFEEAHAKVRPEVQQTLRAHGLRDRWPTCRAFIEEQWDRPDLRDHFRALLWRRLNELRGIRLTFLLVLA